MTGLLPAAALALLAIPLSACVTVADEQNVETFARPEGTPVALGQPVYSGALVATPAEVVEDSRCPAGAQCVWAGRLVVETRIDGPDWLERVELTLGEPITVRGHRLTLVSAVPEPQAEVPIPRTAYRFVFAGS